MDKIYSRTRVNLKNKNTKLFKLIIIVMIAFLTVHQITKMINPLLEARMQRYCKTDCNKNIKRAGYCCNE